MFKHLDRTLTDALRAERARRQDDWLTLHKDNLFSASAVSVPCLRVPLYVRRGIHVTNAHGEAKLDRFAIGHDVEKYYVQSLADYVTANGLGQVEPQAEARYGDFVAHTDALWTADGQLPFPIELKSTHPDALRRRENELLALTGSKRWVPHPEHAIQVSLFIILRRLSGLPVSPDGAVVTVALDGRRRVAQVNSETYAAEVRGRMETLRTHWNANTLPPRLENAKSYPCKDCQFWDWCWHDDFSPVGTLKRLKDGKHEVTSEGLRVWRVDGQLMSSEEMMAREWA